MREQEKDRLEKVKLTARISKRNKKSLIFCGSIIAVAMTMALYYIFMPSWIIVVREGEDENALPSIENRFEITQSDLAEFPKLGDAMVEADGNYPYDHWIPPAEAWYWEGTKIVERFDMDSQYPPEYEAFLIYEDNGGNLKRVYHVQVVFSYEHQVQ
ncbi:MAG: hypothetical protein ACREBU_24225, partial [Nitrososphaera sp.]